MDLHFNIASHFTRWVVETGLLHEPFVVLDVGVQGGENPRWHLLGDHLVVHGFDAIEEVVAGLQAANLDRPDRVYHWMAAGSADEERHFYFNAADPCSSSFYEQGADRFGNTDSRVEQARKITVRRLDSLLEDGTIPAADFLKVDVEGFEKEVLLGAPRVLSGLLGAETETSFDVSPTYPDGHLPTLHAMFQAARMRVFDLNFNRVPRQSFVEALKQGTHDIGRPATFNVLFCRNLIEETDYPSNYATGCEPESVDRIIKAMIVYELHGLSDVALDTAVRFKDELSSRIDVEKAVSLLADPLCRAPGHALPNVVDAPALPAPSVELDVDREELDALRAQVEELDEVRDQLEQVQRDLRTAQSNLRIIENSISWRVTRPLRAVRSALLG